MPIETDFRFNQFRDPEKIARMGLLKQDLLGPLRAFIGDGNHKRTWSGPGFNMIWRPHKKIDAKDPNTQDFFLELDVTKETLSFTDITGPNGIANRGLHQKDIALGGLAYQQEVSDVTRKPPKTLHFEPGVWVNIPNTDDPKEPSTVARMGSIPHGTTINAQGESFLSPDGRPRFSPVSIMPFKIGSKDDGKTDIVNFPEGHPPVATSFPARTPIAEAVGLTDAHFADLSKILSDVTDHQKIRKTFVFPITTEISLKTDLAPLPAAPDTGGGTDNIAFLVGTTSGPNANAARMTAIFWVEEVEGNNGTTFFQLQYIQRVLLNFNGLSWPHVSLATMVIVPDEG